MFFSKLGNWYWCVTENSIPGFIWMWTLSVDSSKEGAIPYSVPMSQSSPICDSFSCLCFFWPPGDWPGIGSHFCLDWTATLNTWKWVIVACLNEIAFIIESDQKLTDDRDAIKGKLKEMRRSILLKVTVGRKIQSFSYMCPHWPSQLDKPITFAVGREGDIKAIPSTPKQAFSVYLNQRLWDIQK